jgi:hypothetical protein
MDVVRSAAESQIVDTSHTAGRVRNHVMEFEKRGFRASPLRTDERAPSGVAQPD